MSKEITLTITTDHHRAKLLIAILAVWDAHDGKGLIDLYDEWESLDLAGLALWDIAWSIWGDEGLIDTEMFEKLSKGQEEHETKRIWNLRKLCYKNVTEDPPYGKGVI